LVSPDAPPVDPSCVFVGGEDEGAVLEPVVAGVDDVTVLGTGVPVVTVSPGDRVGSCVVVAGGGEVSDALSEPPQPVAASAAAAAQAIRRARTRLRV
jgi:hypothetical protein